MGKIKSNNIFYLITIFIVLLFNLLFIQQPLLNTLGYEFAALNSLLLVILSGLYSISFLKKNPNKILVLCNKLLLLLLIPFLVTIVYSSLTMFCSFWDGLLFYLLITLPSVFIGCSIGIISLLYVKKYHKIFFVIVIILLALIPVLEIYFNPQVYFYSPLIGYFPGNIYDEGLSPDWKLFFHQFLILIYFIPVIFLFSKKKEFVLRNKIKLAVILLFVAIIFQFLSPSLGYSTTYCSLDSQLSNKIKTGNTTLHYDNITEVEAKYIALNQQYYFEELSKKLKVNLSENIDVYLFNSRQQKKQLFGAGNADVAKPWQYSIYISKDSWENTLQHELIHIFSADFGSGVFKLASGFNAAMIEGLAEAVDNNYDDYSIQEVTALAFNNNYKVNISNLFQGLNFFKQNSTLSYTYSGAFFKYLIDKYGIEKVKSFYNNGNFESDFRTNFSTAQKEFETNIKSVMVIGNKSMADYYFGRLSIIQKVCPRFISDRLNKAWVYFNNNNYNEAEKLFNEVNKKIINYSALMGLSEIYLLRKQNQLAVDLVNEHLNKFINTPYYFNLLFRLGDLYAQSGKIDSAAAVYKKLADYNPNYNLTMIAKVRLALIENNQIKNYAGSNDSVKYKILLNLNKNAYNYNSIPVLIDLSKQIGIEYKTFLKNFDKIFNFDSVESSYALFKLSRYMLENGDYIGSRKMAALSLRFKNGNPFLTAFKYNFDKATWFSLNAEKVSSTFHYFRLSK